MVITISAPHESVFTVFPDGSYLKQAPEMAELASSDYTSWRRLLHNRVQSIHAVMDHLKMLNRSDTGLAGLFDLDKVAVLGHSLGGAASLEAAKQDHRIKAAVLLDPSFSPYTPGRRTVFCSSSAAAARSFGVPGDGSIYE
ncbi:alpha/beta fold hydrolase [Paenibacillus rhizoplanae]